MNRRRHNVAHQFERRGKPIVLPLIALLIALGGWWIDLPAARQARVNVGESQNAGVPINGDALIQATGESQQAEGKPAVSAAPLSGFHRGNAVTCERRPEITFCWWLTKERG